MTPTTGGSPPGRQARQVGVAALMAVAAVAILAMMENQNQHRDLTQTLGEPRSGTAVGCRRVGKMAAQAVKA
jgi:hypothetical protein